MSSHLDDYRCRVVSVSLFPLALFLSFPLVLSLPFLRSVSPSLSSALFSSRSSLPVSLDLRLHLCLPLLTHTNVPDFPPPSQVQSPTPASCQLRPTCSCRTAGRACPCCGSAATSTPPIRVGRARPGACSSAWDPAHRSVNPPHSRGLQTWSSGLTAPCMF